MEIKKQSVWEALVDLSSCVSKGATQKRGQQRGKSWRMRMQAMEGWLLNMTWLLHTGHPDFLSEHSL